MNNKLICPKCGKNTLNLNYRVIKDKYFGYEAIIEYYCDNCGYKSFDVIPLKIGKPIRIKFLVSKKEDLGTIIARYRSASIQIPELGLELYPGVDSKDFITTIEGLLRKFLDSLKFLEKDKEVDNKKLLEVKNKLEKAMRGDLKFTVIVEDPYGLSKIDSVNVEIEELEDRKQ